MNRHGPPQGGRQQASAEHPRAAEPHAIDSEHDEPDPHYCEARHLCADERLPVHEHPEQ